MEPQRTQKPDTTCARLPRPETSATEPLVPPLAASVVYRVASLDQVDSLYEGDAAGFIYARDDHPNLRQLAGKIADLEGAEAAWAAASGMAAEVAVFLLDLESGDRLAVADGVYGKSARLAVEFERFGVGLDRFDPTRSESVDAVLTPRTRTIFVETLSNPLLRLADIPALADRAHRAGARLVVDHTFAPLLARPIELGADLVTHSATKLIGGHSDVTLGLVAGRAAELARIAALGSTFGLTANPYECWLCLRGLSTLAVRLQRTSENALALADRFERHSAVRAVHYPGLASHPDHGRARAIFSGGFGSMVTIDLGSRAAANAFIVALRDRIPFAPSLGDTATTLSHPATTSHRGLSEDQRAREGITPGLVRISVGLEDPEDLWSEFATALAGQL